MHPADLHSQGYDYCPSCTDYQALLPRRGPARGYDPAPVCAFCIDMLNGASLLVYRTVNSDLIIPLLSHCPWPCSATITPTPEA